jgi:hypothetical protein
MAVRGTSGYAKERIAMIRKPLSLRQALALLSIGALVGYPSLTAAGHCAWGGNCPSPRLVMAGVFIGGIAFISGLTALLVVAIKSGDH